MDKRFIRITVIGLAIFSLLGLVFQYLKGNLLEPSEDVYIGGRLEIAYPVEKVQIISPLDADSVKCRSLAVGVCPDPHDQDIWVLLRPSDDRYYPQSDYISTSYKRNGEWEVIIRFGGRKGELFEVNVYETDEEGSEFFSTTLDRWKKELSYPGLTDAELPAGARLVDRIVVPLGEDCRRVF